MFNRIQFIGSIEGDNNLIINGDVICKDEILTVLTSLSTQLFRRELEILTQEARNEIQQSINECIQCLLEQIVNKHLEKKLSEFARPNTQLAWYSVLQGYTMSETTEQREMIVDSMIERLQTDWNSTERMIINSAIEILPKLSPATLSTIGLLQLRHQMVIAPIGIMLDQYFASLSPLAEQLSDVGILEIDYLKQEKLILPIPGNRISVPFEQILLHNYDLFFRKPLPSGVYDAYCNEHPEAHEAVTDEPIKACMMWVNGMNNNETAFCCPNSRKLKKSLVDRGQTHIIPHVDALMGRMPLFTEQEVRDYFLRLSPSWDRLFKLFSSSETLRYELSITGKYIGSKILAKISHCQSLPLSEYKIKDD